MVNDLSAGIKNALERGASIEQAVASFVNAGYNPLEVQAAAKQLTEGSSSEVLYGEKTLLSPTAATARNVRSIQQTKEEPLMSSINSTQAKNPNAPPTQNQPLSPPKIEQGEKAKKKKMLLIGGIIAAGIVVLAISVVLIMLFLPK